MRKSNWTLLIFLIVGILAGTLVGELLSSIDELSLLTKTTQITWNPRADLQVIEYDLNLQIRLNIVSILGMIAAIWIYRKL